MTKEITELVSKLEALQNESDTEDAHWQADKLLLDFIGDEDIKKAYDALDRWYA